MSTRQELLDALKTLDERIETGYRYRSHLEAYYRLNEFIMSNTKDDKIPLLQRKEADG